MQAYNQCILTMTCSSLDAKSPVHLVGSQRLHREHHLLQQAMHNLEYMLQLLHAQ